MTQRCWWCRRPGVDRKQRACREHEAELEALGVDFNSRFASDFPSAHHREDVLKAVEGVTDDGFIDLSVVFPADEGHVGV